MRRYLNAWLCAVLLAGTGCSEYDDARIREDLDDVEAQLDDLENQMKDLDTQMSSLTALLGSHYVTLLSTDADGQQVISYMAPDGTTHTVTLITGDKIVTQPVIGIDEDEGAYYWCQTSDNGKTWEWIYTDDTHSSRYLVGGEKPEIGIDDEGYFTVNGVPLTRPDGSKILADDVSNRLFEKVEADETTGEAVFTLVGGTEFRIPLFEALTLAFDTPVYTAVPDAATPVRIRYEVGGSMADEAVVELFTAYNVKAELDPIASTISVSMDASSQEGDEGNILVLAHSAAGTVLKPLFFTFGTAAIADPSHNGATGDIVLEGDATTFDVSVSANIDYTVSIEEQAQSWLRQRETRAMTTTTYSFVADAYEDASGAVRSGTIRFANELYDISASITVRQSPKTPEDTGGGIANASDLMAFANAVNMGASTARWQNEEGAVVLLNDIDMNAVEQWTPIGGVDGSSTSTNKPYSTVHPFKGVFDGKGFAIRNLHYTADVSGGQYGYALFGSVEDAVVRNLVLGDAETDISWRFTGLAPKGTGVAALVVYALNSQIENVVNYYDIDFAGDAAESSIAFVGGIAAAMKNSTIGGRSRDLGCINYGDVYTGIVSNTQSGGSGIQNGGICAYMADDAGNVIQYCENHGHISCPTGRTGGIVGTLLCGAVRNCDNYGLIEDDLFDQPALNYNHKRMGGIVGGTADLNKEENFESSIVESCTNYGNVFAHHGCRTGGFIGHSKVRVVGCENRGVILSDATDGQGPGWACGYSAASSGGYTNVCGCTMGGKVGDYSVYKDNPQGAPDANVHNAFAYKNDEYFDAAKNN